MTCRVLTHSNNLTNFMNYFVQELKKTVPEGEWLETCYQRFLHCAVVVGRVA